MQVRYQTARQTWCTDNVPIHSLYALVPKKGGRAVLINCKSPTVGHVVIVIKFIKENGVTVAALVEDGVEKRRENLEDMTMVDEYD